MHEMPWEKIQVEETCLTKQTIQNSKRLKIINIFNQDQIIIVFNKKNSPTKN